MVPFVVPARSATWTTGTGARTFRPGRAPDYHAKRLRVVTKTCAWLVSQMDMSLIFGVFSRRTPTRPTPRKPLTEEFRHRVVMALRDALGERWDEFWVEIHKKLAYLQGKPRLSAGNAPNAMSDVMNFIMNCPDDQFFDFV